MLAFTDLVAPVRAASLWSRAESLAGSKAWLGASFVQSPYELVNRVISIAAKAAMSAERLGLLGLVGPVAAAGVGLTWYHLRAAGK